MRATGCIDIYHPAPPSSIMRLLTLDWKNEHLETSSAAVSRAMTAQGGRTRRTCGRAAAAAVAAAVGECMTGSVAVSGVIVSTQ